MSRVVMKFGGTSVADLDRIRNVARHVRREVNAGNQVAVVVSAMAGQTDQLQQSFRRVLPRLRPTGAQCLDREGAAQQAGLLLRPS